MTKQDYLKLVTELMANLGLHGQKPDDMANNFELEGHAVGLAFDEAQAPNTLFVYMDLGASSVAQIERKLLDANAAMLAEADGLGCFGRWKDTGSIVYRAQLRFTTTTRAGELTQDILRVFTSARSQLQQAVA